MRRALSVGFAIGLMVVAGVERWGYARGGRVEARVGTMEGRFFDGGGPFPPPPMPMPMPTEPPPNRRGR